MSIFTKEIIKEITIPVTISSILEYINSNEVGNEEAEKLLEAIIKNKGNKVISFIISRT